jgi:hypothetical protein
VVIDTPNAPCVLLFYITECLPDMKQVVHLIIATLLILSRLGIKIFIHMSYPRLIGRRFAPSQLQCVKEGGSGPPTDERQRSKQLEIHLPLTFTSVLEIAVGC